MVGKISTRTSCCLIVLMFACGAALAHSNQPVSIRVTPSSIITPAEKVPRAPAVIFNNLGGPANLYYPANGWVVSGPNNTVFVPPSLNFGKQPVGASATIVVSFTNTRSFTVVFKSVAILGSMKGDYSQTNDCIGPVSPGAQGTINATFTPTVLGKSRAELCAPGKNNERHFVPLQGQGI